MPIAEIDAYLRSHADAGHAEGMRTTAPGVTNIYGVRGPAMNALLKMCKPGSFELIEQLWSTGNYEMRMLAVKLMEGLAKKNPEYAVKLVKKFAKEIDNWAICDTIGMKSLKKLMKPFPETIFALSETWCRSKNMWERRLSMVILWELCKDASHHKRIRAVVEIHRSDKEKYIKKAVVWLDKTLTDHSS